MKAVVTGATGCVGWHIANHLVECGWDVSAVVRKTSKLDRLGSLLGRVGVIEADLTSRDDCRRIARVGADAVFHAAGNTSHWCDENQQLLDNALATQMLASELVGTRFIFTSTGATLGLHFLDEAAADKHTNCYARTKRMAEIALDQLADKGLDYVVLNPIIVLGTHDWHNYSGIFKTVLSGKAKYALPGSIEFLDARDLAKAHLGAFYSGKSGEYYPIGGTHTSWLRVYQEIAKCFGVKPPTGVVSQKFLWAKAVVDEAKAIMFGSTPEITRQVVGLLEDAPRLSDRQRQRAERDLGYTTRPLEETILHVCKWIQEIA